jgi:hypothetical protein
MISDKASLTLLLVASTCIAHAAAWESVSGLPDTQLDKESITKNGEIVSVWYRERKFLTPIEIEQGRTRRNYVEYNCTNRLMSYKAIQFFVGDRPDGSQSSIADQSWKPIAPDTDDEAIFRVVCKKWYEVWK